MIRSNKMGNYLSGNRKANKKSLTTDCNFIDSYKLKSFESLPLIINKEFKQIIDVTYNTKKRHGGKVKYFECPYCKLRARFLYVLNNRLACRTCQDLTYESSQCKNKFNSLAKMLSEDFGVNPDFAKKMYRPRKNPY